MRCWTGEHAHVSTPIDANGNLTADGARTFEWDARNQLASIVEGSSTWGFIYNGLQELRRTTVTQSSTTVSDVATVWCDTRVCEERDWTTGTALKQFQTVGQTAASASVFFGLDHLGSVRSVTNNSGTTLSRYEFDPWGRRTLESGSDMTPVSFTGHRAIELSSSVLLQTPYRQYSADLGRWLSEDPAGLAPDVNLFRYVSNRPLNLIDPTGLAAVLHCEQIRQGVSGANVLLPVRHCYISVECEELDDTLEIWGPGADGRPGYGRPRRLPRDSSRGRRQPTISRDIQGGTPYDDCDLERKLVDCYERLKNSIPPYVATGPNSNTFARDVIQCAGGRVQFPWSAPGAKQ